MVLWISFLFLTPSWALKALQNIKYISGSIQAFNTESRIVSSFKILNTWDTVHLLMKTSGSLTRWYGTKHTQKMTTRMSMFRLDLFNVWLLDTTCVEIWASLSFCKVFQYKRIRETSTKMKSTKDTQWTILWAILSWRLCRDSQLISSELCSWPQDVWRNRTK